MCVSACGLSHFTNDIFVISFALWLVGMNSAHIINRYTFLPFLVLSLSYCSIFGSMYFISIENRLFSGGTRCHKNNCVLWRPLLFCRLFSNICESIIMCVFCFKSHWHCLSALFNHVFLAFKLMGNDDLRCYYCGVGIVYSTAHTISMCKP